MNLSIEYSGGSSSHRFHVRLQRWDSGQWLDPSDPTGGTWSYYVPMIGWPLQPIHAVAQVTDADGVVIPTPLYRNVHRASIPTHLWPDALDVSIYVHQLEPTPATPDDRLAEQVVRNYRDQHFGHLMVPVLFRS